MAALPALITVEQFRQMPDDGRACELHLGEVVCVTRPTARHYELRCRLVELLRARCGSLGRVRMEFPYRPVADFDLRVADVAVVSELRWAGIDPEDNLHGAPELVVEVKSPSSRAQKLRELASLCLSNGGLECWIVESKQRSVTVIHRDGTTALFENAQRIPLAVFEGGELPLEEIFGGSAQ